MKAVSWEQQDLLLNLYIQPKASRDQLVGYMVKSSRWPLLRHLWTARPTPT